MEDHSMSESIRRHQPLTVPSETTVAETCRRMHERHASAALVTGEDGALLGIFTGRDAVRVLAKNLAGHDPVKAAMTHAPTTLPAGCVPMDALHLMQDGGFRHVPLLEDGIVAGIISWGDFRTSELDQLGRENILWERI